MKNSTSTLKLLEQQNFIIFGTDFARHPHALEHIVRPLFEKNRFIWVDTVGLRSPTLSIYDLKRIFEKISKWIIKPKAKLASLNKIIPKNVILISPFMIPYNQLMMIRKFNQWSVSRSVNQAIKMANMSDPILITCLPNTCDVLGAFNERLKIYFCVDELSLWPGLNKELIIKLEKKLIENVDLIITTSDHLAKTKTLPNQLTPIITHGVDFNHFNIGPLKTPNQKLNLCYFGLFDERNDQLILKELALKLSNAEIHIIGNVVCDKSFLSSMPNIIFHGQTTYDQLPEKISAMDMFILPYVRNTLTDNINPLKLKEYLSTGRPVIATALPEIVKLKDYLYVAANALEFKTVIENLQAQVIHHDSNRIIEYIKAHETWSAKAELLSELICNNINSKKS